MYNEHIMPRLLLPLAFILIVSHPAEPSENGTKSGKIWGWFKVRAQEKYRAMEDIMSGLAGSHYYIRYIPLTGAGEPVSVFCLTPAGMTVVKDIVGKRGDLRSEDRDGEYSIIHFIRQGYEDRVTQVIRILSMGGYFDYALSYIDDFSLVGDLMRCPLKKAQCLGEGTCNFIKTASLSFPVQPSADDLEDSPLELASLLVHEAAHLERCYDDEDYARYQEERFKSALFARMRDHPDEGDDIPRALTARLVMNARVHIDAQWTEPTPLENFSPPYIIEPRVTGSAHFFRSVTGKEEESGRSRSYRTDLVTSLKTVIGQAL